MPMMPYKVEFSHMSPHLNTSHDGERDRSLDQAAPEGEAMEAQEINLAETQGNLSQGSQAQESASMSPVLSQTGRVDQDPNEPRPICADCAIKYPGNTTCDHLSDTDYSVQRWKQETPKTAPIIIGGSFAAMLEQDMYYLVQRSMEETREVAPSNSVGSVAATWGQDTDYPEETPDTGCLVQRLMGGTREVAPSDSVGNVAATL